ncbi:GGDEF domain-containing protein [Massilia sp. TW-1]|uniref:diguanylate cyclase n=1 Tax=Telluria antibiotica TaxID=2717319 RepID=A0ABX0P7V6_9BURK|nr:GGDEF domain-containing protein [Telluria antibiotica]NIA52754.1 GGDEF domain-containing protein [Telluria antibiotica]
MAQQTEQAAEQEAGRTGIYLSPMAQRRADFSDACGPLFARLHLADSADVAASLMARAQPDLLIIDLDRFEPSIDLDALGDLVARRAGAPVLLLCPFAGAAWLPALMAFGPLRYAITPLNGTALRATVETSLAQPAAPASDAAGLRALLGLRARVQAALDDAEDAHTLAESLCAALCAWPGVLHAGVFLLREGSDLLLVAQQGPDGLLLGALLQRTDRLLQAPLRHAFPGLLAAASGTAALIEAPEQPGEPALADGLRAHGAAMALGLPIPADGPGAPRGALSLLFEAPHAFSLDEWNTLADVARLAAFGLRLAAIGQENEHLLVRLTYISTMDALTGVANRRHGEELLDKEIKRARRYRVPLALLAFDIDRFKAVNDTYGYPVGDVALRTVADTARAVLRASDVLVRSGGEEFHIIAPHTSAIDGLRMAEKVRVAIEQAEIPGCDHVTVSLGVAQLGEQESGDSLTQRAEAALARAKRAGRNCVELAMQ